MNEGRVKVVLKEREGERGPACQYVKVIGEERIVRVVSDYPTAQFQGLKHLLSSIFLPQGYPSSVSDDYIAYQIWDTIQAFASSLSGSLSTRAVLEGVGVGSSTSSPLAATLMWLIKDGTGMVGRILFAWCNGTKLDADSKKWRFFADILNDFALTMELCAPFAVASVGGSTGAMTAVLCTAGVAKSIVGVAGGATRAALTQHQARQGNLADVSAKDGSQETLVNLAALITSLWLLPILDDSSRLTWLAFAMFTMLHVFANFKAVKSVTMETLNRTRYLIVLKQYASNKSVPSIKDANKLEPVLMGFIPTEEEVCGFSIRLGSSISNLGSLDTLESRLAEYVGRNYALIPDAPTNTIYLVYKSEISAEEMLESYALAVFAAMLANNQHFTWIKSTDDDIQNAIRLVQRENLWRELKPALAEQSWNLQRSLLAPGEWRASW